MLRAHLKPATAGPSWTVPALCRAYNWPQGARGSGSIGILELGGGWIQSDVNRAFAAVGQPLPTIVDVSINGGSNNRNTGDPASGEVALDIQIAGQAFFAAAARPAMIRVYWLPNSIASIAAGIRAATRDGCAAFSISWGASESAWPSATLNDAEAAAKAATVAGTVVFAASGDNDANDGGGVAAVDAPASCPHIIGCGGTWKTSAGEGVWNDNPGNPSGEGTGGGFSAHFPVQAWQTRAPIGRGRMVPDVCANADPQTPYQIVLGGANWLFGGTSCVAPLWAGLSAAVGAKGWITPLLYQHPEAFTDIMQGENGVYSAGPGPDPCSGIGSPIGAKIAALFASPSSMFAISNNRVVLGRSLTAADTGTHSFVVSAGGARKGGMLTVG